MIRKKENITSTKSENNNQIDIDRQKAKDKQEYMHKIDLGVLRFPPLLSNAIAQHYSTLQNYKRLFTYGMLTG